MTYFIHIIINNDIIKENLNKIIDKIIKFIISNLNNNKMLDDTFKLYLNLKYLTISNIKLCEIFNKLKKIPFLELNLHSTKINNYID